jgi:NTE family protein
VLKDVKRIAGTSAGAIMAAMLACGARPIELHSMISRTPFKRFLGPGGLFGAASDLLSLFRTFGLNSADTFETWLDSQLIALGFNSALTFAQLRACAQAPRAMSPDPDRRYAELSVVATDLTAGVPIVFCADRTPGMRISKAIRASMSIPLFFEAFIDEQGHVLVDGGVSWNYPIDLFDPAEAVYAGNTLTLGFWVNPVRSFEQSPAAITGLRSFLEALSNFAVAAANDKHLHAVDEARTIFIDSGGVSVTNFNITPTQILTLEENGRNAAREWLDAQQKKEVES